MNGRSVCFFHGGLIATLLLSVPMSASAADVREKVEFKGPFDMRMAAGARFDFECDNPGRVQRRFVYFKSGQGYYKVPFNVPGPGKNAISIDKKDCVGTEGKVAVRSIG